MLFLSSLAGPERNSFLIVTRLLRMLHVQVSAPTIKRSLEEHPDFPSLLSISDALTSWKIDNLTLQASAERLQEYPVPFLVKCKQQDEVQFHIVKQVSEGGVLISASSGNSWKQVGWENFNKMWEGVVMVMEPAVDAGEPAYNKIRRELLGRRLFKLGTLLAIGMLLLWHITGVLMAEGWHSWIPLSLFVLKSIGCYIGVLLLLYEIDGQQSIVQKVCRGGKHVNCKAVLQSRAARILGVSWSELGFCYFAGGLLVMISGSFAANAISTLGWINLLVVPYTLFSVYYQWRVVRQWCLMCLAVQGVLVLELALGIGGEVLTTVHPEMMWNTFYFFIPLAMWFLLKPVILQARETRTIRNELNRVKYNREIFDSLLLRQQSIQDPAGLGITLGNPDGSIKLIKVCNPYCGPCAKAHPEIDMLLHMIPELQVQIIFTARNMKQDKRTMPVKHLMAVAAGADEALTRQALDDWYNAPVKDYALFAEKYRMNGEVERQGEKLDKMSKWCEDVGIMYTPTFFIHGHKLPEIYHVDDLKHFITS